ncbi:YihY/virulence factor BrkB family protein [Imtechella halotolerans]|uniref:Putative ribonuclease-like protein yfkH n=1 Tax=Imtechella halotolerans K1 TaxID=946077 RepID=I0W7A5_9FLAO|nr:YihY/virulence factor BrkB family protein [Imtechella halotolerans]EID72271.1 putative ribonuclease-like protein yfkH [Imtechella halotolerans K1]WMQ64374.1 YihY/virulence factor BrkB family protein [Imtechella halotolerans]
MSVAVEEKLAKIPVVNVLVTILKRIKLRTFEGLSMYDLMEMYVIGIIKGTLTYRASAISFSFFMAIFPFLLFILNLIPYVPIENFQADFLLFIDNLLPPQTNDFFGSIFEDIAKNRRGGLLSTVFVLSIFLMTNGINAIFGGFEISYHVKTTRNIIKQYFIALGVAVIMALLLLLAAVIFISFDVYIVSLLEQQGISRDAWFITYGKILLFLFITYIAIAILYYFGTAEGKENSFFSPGALLTTILFVLTTYLFGIYIEHFSQYNQLYGSIGGLLIFMLYIWLNSNILLLGFELNASLNSLKRVL